MRWKDLPIRYGYCILIGTALGFIMGAKTYLPFLYWGETSEYQWQRYFLPHFINNTLWGFLVPVVFYFFRRFPIARGSSAGMKVKAFLASFGMAAFHEVVSNIVWFLPMDLLGIYPFTDQELNYVIGAFPSALISRLVEYWIIFALFAAIDYARRLRDKQVELARMESQLSSAQLNALRLQLQPHFLFNTLNTISSLMEISIKDAQKMVSKLGNLLRTVLEKDRRHTISLRDELLFIKSYLDIEQVRFQDRLDIRYDIDPATLDAQVPSLLLQPLVENAIKHGFARKTGSGYIQVQSLRLPSGTIRLQVADDGKGCTASLEQILEKGIGLRNVIDRLKLIYKDNYRFSLRSGEQEGFTVQIELPEVKPEAPPTA